jgi:hypothetical protein
MHDLRDRVERTCAWEETLKRLLLQFERIQQRLFRMKLLAYTLIDMRAFCSAYHSPPLQTIHSLRTTAYYSLSLPATTRPVAVQADSGWKKATSWPLPEMA